jgi:ParB family chromosome partitioning protein
MAKKKAVRRKKVAAGSLGVTPAEAARADSPELDRLAAQVEADGGSVLGRYREPFGGKPVLLAAIPVASVEPTPYQRDPSDAHVKRLMGVVEKIGLFLDPIIAIRHDDRYWTPNGNHRLQALKKLGVRTIVALLVPDPQVAFKILALNTEKAHNLKEKSLEVIRMYRALAAEHPGATEEAWAFQFESPHFITLGLLYETNKRFAGGAFAPILRRVDKFMKATLARGIGDREERAALVRTADEALNAVVARIRKRGVNHPYVKNFLLARTTPLTRARKTLPSFDQTFRKLRENLESFDAAKVRYDDIQRSALVAPPGE